MAVDNFKLMNIKFLMNMFENMYSIPNGVQMFKTNLSNLVRQGQVSQDVLQIITSLYGIENSNTFYESRVNNKIMQVKFLMGVIEGMSQVPNGVEKFKKELDDQVKRGQVLESAKDIIYKVYNLGVVVQDVKPKERVKPVVQNTTDIKDISPENLEMAYYRYITHDDGCHRSYGYKRVIDTPVRPANSEIVYKVSEGDGCSRGPSYSSTPPKSPVPSREQLKEDLKKFEPKPTVSNVDACGSNFGGFNRSRGC